MTNIDPPHTKPVLVVPRDHGVVMIGGGGAGGSGRPQLASSGGGGGVQVAAVQIGVATYLLASARDADAERFARNAMMHERGLVPPGMSRYFPINADEERNYAGELP